MSKQITSLESKIEEQETERNTTWIEAKMDDISERMNNMEKRDDIVARIDDMVKTVDAKIDDHGLRFDSQKRALERMYEMDKAEQERQRISDKKMDRYELMLRRVLGFHENLVDMSARQGQIEVGLQRLLEMAFPPDAVGDDDETGTQYDNDEYAGHSLGGGPSPRLSLSDTRLAWTPPATSAEISKVDSMGPDRTGPAGPDNMGPSGPSSEGAIPPAVEAFPAVAPSPNVTMTSATPVNSQDDAQATTTIVSNINHPPPPVDLPPSSDHLLPPRPTEEANPKARTPRGQTPIMGERRSTRIRESSRAPSPASQTVSKRRGEDDEGGEYKRRKVVPS